MSSLVLLSSNGEEYQNHSVWNLYPPNYAPPALVPLSPNVTYYFYAQIDLGPTQRQTPITMVRLAVDQDYGSCARDLQIVTMDGPVAPTAPTSVGKPVNVINGNMFLSQTDYRLPGIGRSIDLTRHYNSLLQLAGIFGLGWTTEYDQYLTQIDAKNIRLQMPDGRGVYFARPTTNVSFLGITPGFPGDIVVNGDNTYTLTLRDGRSNKFAANGKLLWLKDGNGNQTTVNYDVNGVLTGVADPFGRTLNITIGSNGYVSQISDTLGVIATYEYFPSSSLLKTVTYQDGSEYQFEYDSTSAPGKTLLKTVRDALNNILETHLYDSQGRATTSEGETIGGIVQEKYSLDYSNSAFTTVTDGLGRQTKYHFVQTGSRNVVSKVEGLCGCGGSGSETSEYFYDTQLNVTKKIDALGRETLFSYDANNNVTSITDLLGTQTFTYNSLNQVLSYRDRIDSQNSDPNVKTMTNTYDANGNLLTTTTRNVLADNSVRNETTTLTYTTLGQPATIKDPLDHTTTLTYDSQGRLTQIKDANNKNTNLGYDARARLISITNALNVVTNLEYDARNRLKKVIYPDTNFITYNYDLAGRRSTFIDARSNTTTFAYDAASRLIGITDPLNHTISFGYDRMSNPISQTDALGNATSYEYDDFDRPKKVLYPPASPGATRLEESVTYDQVGNVKTHVNTAGRTTSYDYDTSNRLIKITDALQNLTQFEYNARSQMTKVKDALNQEYLFSFDVLGRVLSEARAGSTMSFEYDAAGNQTKRTDQIGRETAYEYDALNRLKKINYLQANEGNSSKPPIATAEYNYDDLSRLVSAINQAGTVSFTYDNRNRLKTETDVYGHVIEYAYDANSNRNLLKLDGSNYATYAYDVANRLTSITNSADSSVIGFGYDNAGRLTSRTYPNSVTTTYDYDGMSRLTRLKDTATSGTLFDRQYAYTGCTGGAANNQICQIIEPSGTRTFGYDDLDRLISVTDTVNGNESYSYDAVGNRTASHRSTTYSYQSFNRLTSTQTAAYTFGASGNTTSKSEGSKRWSYLWDYENRLTKAWDRKNTVRYVYDALGRRVSVHGTKGRTKITYDGEDALLDDVDGALTKYINGPGIDSKLRQTTGSTTRYFLGDHLGSTNGLADTTGAITSQTAYDSFGNQSGTLSTRYGFTGRERDDTTTLMYYRARWYDPSIGRFISEDPVGFYGGKNLYTYVANNPLDFTDPMGLFPSMWRWKMQQQIGRNALSGSASPTEIEALNNANQSFDVRTQDPIYAPYHAMRRPGQSVDDARSEANDFVRRKICLARKYAALGLTLSAMEQLGQAAHTMQDAESPAHSGFQKAWPDTRYYTAINAWHYVRETFFPGEENVSAAEENTRKVWMYYKGTPMPSNFFSPSSSQLQCECPK